MRDQTLKLGIYITSIIGLIDALYLTWVKLTHRVAFCGTYGGCETVNTSSYASILGIPIAVFGAGAYLVIIILLFLENKGQFWKENSPILVFGITLVGVLYSIYLTYIEIAVLHAICPYCVVSGIAMLVLFFLAILRLVRGQAEVNPI
jgi:uncharacterized membrane protein